jgi:2-oxoglutarate ferredoxin oxidoreductase subunit alpha
MMKRIEAINDFVVKFANVNGSGSASANELFARSFLRMGIPVSPRNIFPSNIQGLPTWYEVRVTERGWLGRRGGVDMMVAMNPQTWEQDLKEVEPGGYLFYDNTKVIPHSRLRPDIHVVGMPLTEICNSTYSNPRERQLFKNIICLGALAGMMGIDVDAIISLIAEQYKGKERLLQPNVQALRLGLNYAASHLHDAIGLKAKMANAVGQRIFMEGNAAVALGAVYGGQPYAPGTRLRLPRRWLRLFKVIVPSLGLIPKLANIVMRSCKLKTSWLPSVWFAGRDGTGQEPLLRLRDQVFRSWPNLSGLLILPRFRL